MRRFLTLFTVLMLSAVLAFAQSRVVTGKVTDANGRPVSFASVVVKGGGGVQANQDGEYSIKVQPGDVLLISAAGLQQVEIPVGSMTYIDTRLTQRESTTIQEVVVTSAFGIKRAARGQASNVQNVNSEQLNTIRQQNVNDALAGKVAGVQVRSQSAGKLGAENVVRLRGENAIASIGGGALYVVDGTIVPSAGDINTDDIEDVTILQGPAAAALFGAEGSNGAIVINTKKGRKNQRGIGLELNSNIQFDKVYIMPHYQNTYAGGTYNGTNNVAEMVKFNYIPGYHPAGWAALDGKYYIDDIEDESWGPKMVGQEYIPWYSWYGGHDRSYSTSKLVPQPNNARDFYNTGVSLVNNVSFTKAGDDYNLRLSYTNRDQKGIVPTSYLKRDNFNANVSVNLGSKFVVGANINFMAQKANAENDDTYSNNTTGSFNQWFHRDLDMNIMREMRGYRNEYGQLATWNHATPQSYDPASPQRFYAPYYWFSPFAWQDNVTNEFNRNRLFGDASLTYKANNDLSLKFTYRKNQLNTDNEARQYNVLAISNAGRNSSGFNYWETISGRSATWQGFGFGNGRSNRQNYEALATYRKKFKEFQFGGNLGLDILKTNSETVSWNSLGGLTVPDEFLVSNSVKQNPQTRTINRLNRRSIFARADVGFRNYAFLEGSVRRDYYSSQRKDNAISTYSIGGSLILSDLLGLKSSTLNYVKLRASIGEISNALAAYQNSVLYDPNLYPINYNGNIRTATEPDRLVDPSLRGAKNTEKEFGVEVRMFKNRFTLNATYWDRTNKDFPYDVTIYPGTGFTQLSTNTGKVVKRGVELQATATPIRWKNLEWIINGTWGYMLENKVVSIAKDIKRTNALSNGQAGTNAYVVNEEGKTWGQLIGRGIMRRNGVPVVDPSSGLFVLDTALHYFGSVLPKYTGGFQNTFNVFKNFTINVNIDYQFGGKFFSLSKYYGFATGLMAETAVMNDRGFSVRDNVADGGGVHVVGVDENDKAVDMYIPAGDYFRQFAYGDGIVDPMIQDLTFVKLREFSLGYRLPIERMGGISKYVKNAVFSVVSRNPLLIYTKTTGFDPSEISTNYGEDGQMPGTRSLGVNLKIGF